MLSVLAYRGNLRGIRGVPPTFWTEDYRTPHFSGRKDKKSAVIMGDMHAEIKLQ